MSRWKALPAELDPRVRQLVVRLRRLKDHSGLSMRQLAAKTGYSPKSWERYLGGGSLPPWEAVEALARIGGDDPVRLLALHEVAADAWGNRRAGASAPEDPAAAEPEVPAAGPGRARLSGRSLRVALVAGAVALTLAVSSAVLLFVRLGSGRGEAAAANRHPAVTASADPSPPAYVCRYERVGGRWYAGNSRTRSATLGSGNAGPEVAEAQCLLRRAGISPGGIDGLFGPLTRSAVKDLQKRAGLVVDGVIGPYTWKALRA
ncbi:peptidoglycan-binding protein [Streptomyces sp. NPDC058964]|uniref:peptidoglycan-binding protein n=1 Tax=Streptomyces sp. NPDC058964 TaxID=3346681 RepID=UPI0036BE784F